MLDCHTVLETYNKMEFVQNCKLFRNEEFLDVASANFSTLRKTSITINIIYIKGTYINGLLYTFIGLYKLHNYVF